MKPCEARAGGWKGPGASATPVDFESLCANCLIGLETMLIAADEVHRLCEATQDLPLPRTLNMHLLMASSRLLRGTSQLNPNLYELTRLVRIYAKPWEDKGTVLAKLHKTYAQNRKQLQLALTELQTTGADLERMKEDRLCMLWERLFAKAMSTERHGRRWKFLIESFKQAAEKGEHLNFAVDTSDEEDEDSLLIQKNSGFSGKQLPVKGKNSNNPKPNLLLAAEQRQQEQERMAQEVAELTAEVRDSCNCLPIITT